ncbi:MAG: hypothetical protein EKK41_16885 [Hyphomicrobiales bacterium]|nr:MAG: hypothetical protein EKK41_16885 [Hyphomicrobiales bacterium]
MLELVKVARAEFASGEDDGGPANEELQDLVTNCTHHEITRASWLVDAAIAIENQRDHLQSGADRTDHIALLMASYVLKHAGIDPADCHVEPVEPLTFDESVDESDKVMAMLKEMRAKNPSHYV